MLLYQPVRLCVLPPYLPTGAGDADPGRAGSESLSFLLYLTCLSVCVSCITIRPQVLAMPTPDELALKGKKAASVPYDEKVRWVGCDDSQLPAEGLYPSELRLSWDVRVVRKGP